MNRSITIDYSEIENYQSRLEQQRKHIDNLNTQITQLNQEIKFLKDSGDEILVIVKHENKPDYHEYKTREKSIITDLIVENNSVRNKNEDLANQVRMLESNMMKLNNELEQIKNNYETQMFNIKQKLSEIENRGLFARIVNKKTHAEIVKKEIEQEEEIKISKAIETKKPRGWHFMVEFVDEDGNVYHKGTIQPKLKGTKQPTK